jgi:hypothetical protein
MSGEWGDGLPIIGEVPPSGSWGDGLPLWSGGASTGVTSYITGIGLNQPLLPAILEGIWARTGLETPQVLTSWVYRVDPFWWEPWLNVRLRRTTDIFPESEVDGTAVLTEAYSEDPPTYATDLTITADIYGY